MTSKRSGIIEKVKTEITSTFLMIDMRPINFYLGLKIKQDQKKQTIRLFQAACIIKVLTKFYFDKAHVVYMLIKETAIFEHKTKKESLLTERQYY